MKGIENKEKEKFSMLHVHIGTLQCADWFHSRNGHTVLSGSDSQNAGNPGIPPTISSGINKTFYNSRNDQKWGIW